MESIFFITTLLVLPWWALMILAPTWSWTRRVIASPLIALLPALVYLAVVAGDAGDFAATFANPQLSAVADYLSGDAGTVVAWAHFLAFDLFVGRWAYLDSRERAISPFLMAPVLLAVFLAGPIGFALYLGVRAASRRADAPVPVPA